MKNFRFYKPDDALLFDYGMSTQQFDLTNVQAIKVVDDRHGLINIYRTNGVSQFTSYEKEGPTITMRKIDIILSGIPYIVRCSNKCIVNTDLLLDISTVSNKSKDMYMVTLHFENRDIAFNLQTEDQLKILEILLRHRLESKVGCNLSK